MCSFVEIIARLAPRIQGNVDVFIKWKLQVVYWATYEASCLVSRVGRRGLQTAVRVSRSEEQRGVIINILQRSHQSPVPPRSSCHTEGWDPTPTTPSKLSRPPCSFIPVVKDFGNICEVLHHILTTK